MTAATESLADAYERRDETTVEIDARRAHRAWAFLDILVKSEDQASYAADSKARDALAEALHEAGELPEDRL